ncbi:MAG: hypothetical protein VX899_22740 [Myxococcota bacterium]|nr:hypothetical protein [Myxococcota bacterium]
MFHLILLACTTEPADSETDCFDGVDEDRDGLMDCEDADCADAWACTESDCSDGSDNDGDGLADCDDDDCLARQECGLERELVLSSAQLYRTETHGRLKDGDIEQLSTRYAATLADLEGSIRYSKVPGAALSTASQVGSCSFHFDRLELGFNTSSFAMQHSFTEPSSSGLVLGSGCEGLSAEDLFPLQKQLHYLDRDPLRSYGFIGHGVGEIWAQSSTAVVVPWVSGSEEIGRTTTSDGAGSGSSYLGSSVQVIEFSGEVSGREPLVWTKTE